MQVRNTAIPGVKIIQPDVLTDHRGFFLETFSLQPYREALNLPDLTFVQDNHSRSHKNVLRGLHYQHPYSQGKLVRCVYGEIFDVAVDLRQNSLTYAQWVGILLSGENKTQLWIPPGMAHGFVVLSDVADFEYKCTDYYNPQTEACLSWNDPDIAIDWPVSNPILSKKDQQGKKLRNL